MSNDYYTKQFGGTAASFMTKQTVGMARPINYHTDGTGRDTYIKNINGGLYIEHKPVSFAKGGVFRTHQNPAQPLCNLGVKRSHYYCNGTGRDCYVRQTDETTGQTFSRADLSQQYWSGFRQHKARVSPADFAKPVATKQARALSKVTTVPKDSYLTT